MRIAGSHFVVTGASGGIGGATCGMLLDAGATAVGMLARDKPELHERSAALAARYPGQRVVALPADIRDGVQVRKAMADFVSAVGKLDGLVNAAGVLLDGAIFAVSFRGTVSYPLEKWQQTLDTNLTGAYLANQAALEQMLRPGQKPPVAAPPAPGEAPACRGVIVNISSVSRLGRAGQGAYSASKGGLVSLTVSLAQELAPYRIRCVAIAPGLVDTAMAQRIPEAYRQDMLAHTGVKRMALPQEVAHAVRFCIENEFFNGRTLELDGGTF